MFSHLGDPAQRPALLRGKLWNRRAVHAGVLPAGPGGAAEARDGPATATCMAESTSSFDLLVLDVGLQAMVPELPGTRAASLVTADYFHWSVQAGPFLFQLKREALDRGRKKNSGLVI